ncbi:MAG: MBL fold metallo-hydrolase [Stackebrandtia sp.]
MTTPRSLTRRRVLGASAAGLTAAAAAGVTSTASSDPASDGKGKDLETEVTLRWLGNNAWEISGEAAAVLIDPWLTRFHTGTYTDDGPDPNTEIVSDPEKIDPHVDRADLILTTHGHFDHLPDIPYIAGKTGATIVGSESHLNMLRALGAPEDQMSTVRGGEFFQFDGYTVEVFRCVHSHVGSRRQLPFPGTRPAAPPDPAPRVISELVEGETLAYLVTMGDVQIIDFGSSNFITREIDGLWPHVALVQPGGAHTPEYVPRLMSALGNPRYVVPTHWDDFDEPLTEPAVDWGGLDALRDAVAQASPDTEFVVVDHLETFTPH